MEQSFYDPSLLLARAQEWRNEAAVATDLSIQSYCLTEAARCVRIVQRSIGTPILADQPAQPAKTWARDLDYSGGKTHADRSAVTFDAGAK